ncbi:MAG TPA: hypothetical protein VHL80_18460 [Polyangia bacterium]|nr:hypothetical protein [Polyangia bacterium]
MSGRAGLLLLPLLPLACVSSEVRLSSARRPEKPAGCEVAVYPDSKPPYPYEDLAEDRAGCVLSRNHCLNRLREDACLVGADTVYGLTDTEETIQTIVEATLARRTGPAPGPGAAAPAPLPAVPTFSR